MTTQSEQVTGPTSVSVPDRPLPQTATSGDIRAMLDHGHAVAFYLKQDNAKTFEQDVPIDEWRVDRKEWTTDDGKGPRMTLLIPETYYGDAEVVIYRPPPLRNRKDLARYDWTKAEASPNYGMLAYWINDRLTAISVPMMVKDGVRHDFWRRLFVELDDAPDWLRPMHYHNDPGLEIDQERELVEVVRRQMR